METWFYEDYIGSIDNIEQQSIDNHLLRQEFVKNTLTDINDKHIEFLGVIEYEHGDCDECEIVECEPTRVSLLGSQHYHDFTDTQNQFTRNTFIGDKISEIKRLIDELENLKSLISNDGVIKNPRHQELNDRIDSLINELSYQLNEDDKNEIILQFETITEFKRDWFLSHYDELITEISERERQNQNDKTTIGKQVEDLESLKSFIDDDGVVDVDLFNEKIDEFIETFSQEIKVIEERERVERERQRQLELQRQRQQQNTRSSGSSGSSSSSSGSGSTGTTSGTGDTGSSGDSGGTGIFCRANLGGCGYFGPSASAYVCPSCGMRWRYELSGG